MEAPKTLQEVILHFANPENCRALMIEILWAEGKVKCPSCGSEKVTYLENAKLYKCYGNHSKQKFSLKVNTIFEDSALPLDKWLVGFWLLYNCKNGISSHEVARQLGITQKSAWHMMRRIRFAIHRGSFEKFSGHVEADETFIGGKARNMHVAQRQRRITGRVRTEK